MPEVKRRYTNRQLADKFSLIADLLEIKGEVIYKILAYRKAADSLNEPGAGCQPVLAGRPADRDPRGGQGHRREDRRAAHHRRAGVPATS